MKYLFLDVEWNQTDMKSNIAKGELLTIGALEKDEEKGTEKKLYHIVRPRSENALAEYALEVLHLDQTSIEQGKPLKEVLDIFCRRFSENEILVVWSQQSYQIFREAFEKEKMKFKVGKVIILQDLLTYIASITNGNKVGMEKELKRYEITYDKKKLHCSDFDARYLMELFFEAKKQYKKRCSHSSKGMGYRNPNSNIIHTKKCHYCGSDCAEVSAAEIFEGMHFCKQCAAKNGFARRKSSKRKSSKRAEVTKGFEEEAEQLCKRYHMKYHFMVGVLSVKTAVATWRIYHDERNIIFVYHENLQRRESDKRKKKHCSNPGFHLQKIKESSLKGVLSYIYYHDKYYFQRKVGIG